MSLQTGYKIVVGGDRKPLADLVFELENVQFSDVAPDKRFVSFDAEAVSDGVVCGFAADMLLTGWEEEVLESDIPIFRGDIRLRSTGHKTEQLVSRLEHQFGCVGGYENIFDRIFCECTAFLHNPSTIEKNEFVGRVFFGDGEPPESDVSVFLIVDISGRRAWFSEKDVAYRQGLISWFRGVYS